MKDYIIYIMHKALSQITHMERSEGNEAVLRVMPVRYLQQVFEVPYLSGNAMRHVMVRSPGWRYLIGHYGLRGSMSRKMMDALLSGGAVSESTRDSNLGRTHRGYEALPLFRMLGMSLPDEIIGGHLDVGHAMLVCRETFDVSRSMVPEGWFQDTDAISGSSEFVRPYQYYRHDATKDHPDRDRSEKDSSMPFGGEAVVPGAIFVQRLVARSCDEQHIGAVLDAIERWDGIAGGQRSRGHGLLESSYQVKCDGETVSAAPLIDEYQNYTEQRRESAIEWLFEAFGEDKPEGLIHAAG